MRTRMVASVVALAGLTLALGACSGTSSSAPPAPATATGPEASEPGAGEVSSDPRLTPTPEVRGMDQLGELLDADGRLTQERALAIWAARITPLPDVTALPEEQVADIDIHLIQSLVAGWLPELTPEQRAVVQAVLDGQDVAELTVDDPDPSQGTDAPNGDAGSETTATTVRVGVDEPVLAVPASARAAAATDAELRLAAVEARTRFERVNGAPVGLPVNWGTAAMRTPDPDNCVAGSVPGSGECPWAFDDAVTGAKTQAVLGPDGALIACRVLMNRDVALPADAAEARRFMVGAIVHELYHCEQHVIVGSLAAYRTIPLWVREGTAAFVGEKAVDGSLYSHRGWWQRWLGEPERGLFARTYDAVGLMWLVDTDLGSPLSGRIAEVVRASTSGSGAAFSTLTTPAGPNLWSRWATHLANQRGPGTDEWHPLGPYATEDRPVAQAFSLPLDGGPVTVSLPSANAAKALRIDLAGEVVEVRTPTATGTGIIDPAGVRHTLAEGSTTRLCVNPAGCAPCPDGRPLRTDQDVAPGSATWYLASSGGTTVSVEAQSRDRACGETAPSTVGGPGSIGEPDEVCNRVLPLGDAEALLGPDTETGHDYSSTATSDLVNAPAYACRWTNGPKYLWATLRTAADGAQEYHGLDQFTEDNVFVAVPGLGSEARLVKAKPPAVGITQLEIVDSGNHLTVGAEGPIANNDQLLVAAGRAIADNWP